MLKKRFTPVLLCAAMVFGMTACSGGQKAETEISAQTESSAETSAPEESETESAEEPSHIIDYEDKEIEEILAGMTLRDKVEQMLVVSYRVWENDSSDKSIYTDVTELNDELRQALTEHHYGGTVLFSQNVRDAEQVVRLVADMQQTTVNGGGLPLLVAADQEGGNVSRLDFGTTGVGNMALAATGDPENSRTMASIFGEELSLLGINTDFAPVMDVNNNPSNPVIGVRSFSDSPEIVTEYGLSFMEGLHDTGTIATLKHFPGHGNTDTDSHTGFPCIMSSYEELKECELIPFQAAIDAGADMIMTAHIQYPEIEEETYISISTGEEVCLPATMSKVILTDILRNDMGFEGVVITDALDMAAISENFSDEDVLTLTINAGVDLLLLPPVSDAETFRHVLDMTETAVALAEEGKIDTDRIYESVRRILTLKKNYGLLDQADFAVTDEMISGAEAGVGRTEHREAAWDIAEKALTLVKNEGDAFPISLESGETALILFADSCASRFATGELAEKIMRENAVIPEDARINVMVNNTENGDECVKAAEEADYVILINRAYMLECLDPATEDGFSTAVFDEIIAARNDNGQQCIVISCQLPYDAARFGEADAILLTYNSAYMPELPPETGEDSAYCPNLAAALVACFGEGQADGKLPVNIPEVDENYKITDTILYEREVEAAE
ncbi:MAG: glycoside hydrolase family 3 protein [Lachnospiraceae bacterium]|nr:glycoside hydrolase family 3 protein [Lachnospiraceae bacterium]